MSDEKRCGARTKAGGTCGAFASKLTGRCSRHDEARSGENGTARLIRRAGDNPKAWKRLIGQAAYDTASGAMSPRAAAAIASLARAWLQAHDRHVLEAEIAELRELAAGAAGSDGPRRRDDRPPADGDLLVGEGDGGRWH
jgi:hypothetical protein